MSVTASGQGPMRQSYRYPLGSAFFLFFFLCSVFTHTRQLTIPDTFTCSPRCRSDEDTGRSSCGDYGLKVSRKAPRWGCGDNFSTLESYLRPAVSVSEGSCAFPQTALFTGNMSLKKGRKTTSVFFSLACKYEKKIRCIPDRSFFLNPALLLSIKNKK